MTFDPFGDYAERGYLRNNAGLHDEGAVAEWEHRAFLRYLPEAVEHLEQVEQITYQDVLDTHKILFQQVYPWAGQDRQTTTPNVTIGKGDRFDLFAHPRFVHDAVHYGLNLAQRPGYMIEHPGEIMGYLAHAHPFLEGNGRTIMTVYNELAHRAGFSIDWRQTNKQDYLGALTRELDQPGRGELDNYLAPFLRQPATHGQSTAMLAELPGLGPDNGANFDHERQRREDAARDVLQKSEQFLTMLETRGIVGTELQTVAIDAASKEIAERPLNADYSNEEIHSLANRAALEAIEAKADGRVDYDEHITREQREQADRRQQLLVDDTARWQEQMAFGQSFEVAAWDSTANHKRDDELFLEDERDRDDAEREGHEGPEHEGGRGGRSR